MHLIIIEPRTRQEPPQNIRERFYRLCQVEVYDSSVLLPTREL
jgi:hypothetical protein